MGFRALIMYLALRTSLGPKETQSPGVVGMAVGSSTNATLERTADFGISAQTRLAEAKEDQSIEGSVVLMLDI
jgi:hypothetical protein